MIDEKVARKYCKEDISKIKNYELAIADTTQTWSCHHILGEILTRQQLLEHDFYYNVPACMLKFVTKDEHTRLHMKGNHLSEETRNKISESMKGNNNPLYGKHRSEETRKKISESMKGSHHSEETRKKLSESRKGKTPFKNHHHSEEAKKKLSEARKGKTWKIIDGKRKYFPKEVD